MPHGWYHAVQNLHAGATLAVGEQVLAGGNSGSAEDRSGRDPSQYFAGQLELVQLQERLRALENEDHPGAEDVAAVLAGLAALLAEHPRLDGCALSLWNAHVLANRGAKAGLPDEARRALRAAADTNPRGVRAQLALARQLLMAGQDAQAHKEAMQRIEFAWSNDPDGYQAPATLCRVLSQLTRAKLARGADVAPSAWNKIATVCGRAMEVVRAGAGGGEAPAPALVDELDGALAAIGAGADGATVALVRAVEAGQARWCAGTRSYSLPSAEGQGAAARAAHKAGGRGKKRKKKRRRDGPGE